MEKMQEIYKIIGFLKSYQLLGEMIGIGGKDYF